MHSQSIVAEKSKAFALKVIQLYEYMSTKKNEFVLSKQILRSGTSIGANISEALAGISEKDYYAKMYIAFKESNETKYWLELLFESEYINKEQYDYLYSDCIELVKILSSITKTTRSKLNKATPHS